MDTTLWYCPTRSIRYGSLLIKPERFRKPQFSAKVMARQKVIEGEEREP